MNLLQICSTRKKELTEAGELRGFAAVLWTDQGDAVAKVGAEVVNGGGALKLDDAGKTKQKGMKWKKEMTLLSYL